MMPEQQIDVRRCDHPRGEGELLLVGVVVVLRAPVHGNDDDVGAPLSRAGRVCQDPRLVDLARLIKSGISQDIIAEQVKQSDLAYNLSVNDVLYLKENGAHELTIAALLATGSGSGTPAAPGTAGVPATPKELTFDGLVTKAFWAKDRPGRLVMQGDTLSWVYAADPQKKFEFKTTGLEKVWFTCQERSPESFCYQINFQIVKGDRYQFQDVNREAGSNAAVLEVMEALRTYFPRIAFGTADNS